MKRLLFRSLFAWMFLGSLLRAQTVDSVGTNGVEKSPKPRPPRIPDGDLVPKRGMIQRDQNQFWAGPQDGNRFIEILTLTMVSRDQLQAKLQAWPPFQKFSDPQKARLVERLDEVRDQAKKEALEVAKEFQLVVHHENQDEFVKKYWMEKLAIEKSIREELSPLRKRLEDEAKKRLEKDFGKPSN